MEKATETVIIIILLIVLSYYYYSINKIVLSSFCLQGNWPLASVARWKVSEHAFERAERESRSNSFAMLSALIGNKPYKPLAWLPANSAALSGNSQAVTLQHSTGSDHALRTWRQDASSTSYCRICTWLGIPAMIEGSRRPRWTRKRRSSQHPDNPNPKLLREAMPATLILMARIPNGLMI